MNNNMVRQYLLDDEYATKDIHFAAFLQVKGMVIDKMEQYGFESHRSTNPVYFIFRDRNMCEELENVFWNGVGDEVMVNAKDYFTKIRELKSRAFSITRRVRKEQSSFK